jgi:hypothetical protein
MDNPAYRIEHEEQDIVIRFHRSLLDRSELSQFLDMLMLRSIRNRSQLTEADAAALADEIDRAVWERNRERISG